MADSANDKRNMNLARIRDNQRRSRARRKDYLAELESKYRQCEQTGVEATAEIQAAARKVVDENRRLRQLLKQQGLTEAEIDGNACDARDSSLANELEGMLGTKKTCKSSSCGGGASNDSKSQSGASVSPPVSVAEQQQSYAIPKESLPIRAETSSYSASYPYHSSNAAYPLQPATTAYSFDMTAPFDWQDPLQHPAPTSVPPLSQSVDSSSSSSCHVAASAVRLVRPDLGPELEQELCYGAGGECTVLNDHIFNIMDRYSNGR